MANYFVNSTTKNLFTYLQADNGSYNTNINTYYGIKIAPKNSTLSVPSITTNYKIGNADINTLVSAKYTEYITPGTYSESIPIGSVIRIVYIGGGGGGGSAGHNDYGSYSSGSDGGAGGGGVIENYTVQHSQSTVIVVGKGGNGKGTGANSNGTPGDNGLPSSVSYYNPTVNYICVGGAGGGGGGGYMSASTASGPEYGPCLPSTTSFNGFAPYGRFSRNITSLYDYYAQSTQTYNPNYVNFPNIGSSNNYGGAGKGGDGKGGGSTAGQNGYVRIYWLSGK